MQKEITEIVSLKQVDLEIELLINRQLYDKKIINSDTYEIITAEILKDIQKEIQSKIE